VIFILWQTPWRFLLRHIHHRDAGREKKFKNDENAKIGLNEIK
jgi:hypothetical protein